jgi:hypothetical protein
MRGYACKLFKIDRYIHQLIFNTETYNNGSIIIFTATASTRPKNWLVESILVTIFCCLPFGIAGIVNAASVNSKFNAGDYAGATPSSKQAGQWTKIGFWIGLAFGIAYAVYCKQTVIMVFLGCQVKI